MRGFAIALAGSTLLAMPIAAFAQWAPGSEIVGQTLQVETNGVTNSVYLGPGGQATITSPGGRSVNAAWTAANGQLCLHSGGAQECWPYQAAFQPGQTVTLTSNCNAVSRWTANATNPPPPAQGAGERG